ncbi:MAG: PilZ domain-containing protein [Planctomycetes bacterium]|nr:PilZ domain-containing protein [Planctomycetota bacterium]
MSRQHGDHQPERRRAARRQLQDCLEVVLSANSGTDDWRCKASMLNASPHGIACRAEASELQDCAVVGGMVRVEFRLAGVSDGFDITGRVVNVTRGATSGQVVLGLEFVADPASATDRDRLCEVLGQSRVGRK